MTRGAELELCYSSKRYHGNTVTPEWTVGTVNHCIAMASEPSSCAGTLCVA